MSKLPKNGKNDQSLNDDLDRLGDAYGQLQNEEPPELLDQAILNRARRAVEKKSHWMQFGWLHGLTTAAVFVLAFSLFLHQREQLPVPEDGISLDESIGLQREKAAKKQAPEEPKDTLRVEMKEENGKRQDVFEKTTVSAPSPSEAMNAVSGDQDAEPEAAPPTSIHVSDAYGVKLDSTQKDATANELGAEELLADEEDLRARAQEQERYRQSQPASIVAPVSREAGVIPEDVAEDIAEIEQKLEAILELKRSGDKAWVTELDLFRQSYPSFPIPDELLN